MKLFELDQQDFETGYYDPTEDKVNIRLPTDTRKPLLTLKHLNRLKKMRAVQKLENLKRQDLLKIMYGLPKEESGGGGSPF
jgi:hypothetical protein